MIEIALALLLIGDYIFTNRENVFFAVQCMEAELYNRKGE